MQASNLGAWARRTARAVLPERIIDGLRVATGRADVAEPQVPVEPYETPTPAPGGYESRYEAHARALPPDSSIGDGDFDEVGRIELSALVQEGLTPSSTLLDFGCGTGRLAVHAIPYLAEGRYIGTDISSTMIDLARDRIDRVAPGHRSGVEWVHQPDEQFPASDASIDVICAFSVFTHMEHEDTYRYLCAARRVLRPGGRLVVSCLPMHLRDAQQVFLASAADHVDTRWDKVRNVTTSIDLFEATARLAGWSTIRWHDGEHPSIRMLGEDRVATLGQSVVVLQVDENGSER